MTIEEKLNLWIVPFAAGALAALLVCEALGLSLILQWASYRDYACDHSWRAGG